MNKNNQASAILELLVKAEVLSKSDRKLILGFMQRWDADAYHSLLSTHILSESELADHLSKNLGLERIGSITKEQCDPKALKMIDYLTAQRWCCFPLMLSPASDRRLRVALCDPSNDSAIEHLARTSQKEIEVCVATKSDILNAICSLYPFEKQFASLL